MRFLITAGPTREYIDSVRFLSNGSTGYTGYLIAEEAVRCGHPTTLVSGPVSLDPPEGVQLERVTSAEEMRRAVFAHLADSDVVIATAAVCDWRPERRSECKLPKGTNPFEERAWVRTPDILLLAGREKGERVHIGFALEDADPRRRALVKLQKKNLDYLVLNSPAAMAGPSGTYTLFSRDGAVYELGSRGKRELAALLVDVAARGRDALKHRE